jgi:hypothetical protein
MLDSQSRAIYAGISAQLVAIARDYAWNKSNGANSVAYNLEFRIMPDVFYSVWRAPHVSPAILNAIDGQSAMAAAFGLQHGRLTATIRTAQILDYNPYSQRFDPDLSCVTLVAMPASETTIVLTFSQCNLFKNLMPWLHVVNKRALEFIDRRITDAYVCVTRATFDESSFFYVLPFLPNPIDTVQAMPYYLRQPTIERLRKALAPLEPDSPAYVYFFDENTPNSLRRDLRQWLAKSHE